MKKRPNFDWEIFPILLGINSKPLRDSTVLVGAIGSSVLVTRVSIVYKFCADQFCKR